MDKFILTGGSTRRMLKLKSNGGANESTFA